MTRRLSSTGRPYKTADVRSGPTGGKPPVDAAVDRGPGRVSPGQVPAGFIPARLQARVVTDAFGPGFRTVETEYRDHEPRVEGTVPSWLSGTLIRNGPGRFEVGGERVNHWFDGLGMLRRYAFDGGEVRYTNRFLRSEAHADAISGETGAQFATDTRGWRRFLSWLRTLGPQPTDNANVHVARLDGEYVALTEAPRRVAFDPVTLETRGEFTFDDDITEHLAAAHVRHDPHRGETVGFATQFGLDPKIHVYRLPDGERRRRQVASLDAGGPGYIHDVSVTADRVVLVEPPLDIVPRRVLYPWTEGVFDLLEWNPDRGTRVVVLDRESGAVRLDTTIEPVFVFHHVNAYDDDRAVVLDVVDFADADIVGSMALDELDGSGFPNVPDGRLARYRIDLDSGAVTRERRYDGGMELPRVVRARRGRRHRYAYGQTTDRTGANGLAKVDCKRDRASEWWERSVFVEEPLPVRRPDADTEDDGVVLATALDVDREQSYLLVFDAATLEERARVFLPHPEPFGFHGRFFRDVDGR